MRQADPGTAYRGIAPEAACKRSSKPDTRRAELVDLIVSTVTINRPDRPRVFSDLKLFEPITKSRLPHRATTKNADRACCDPPGSESITCRLQEVWPSARSARPAPIPQTGAAMALISPGSTSKPVHEPVHGSLRRPLDANYRALPYGARVAAVMDGCAVRLGQIGRRADPGDLRGQYSGGGLWRC